MPVMVQSELLCQSSPPTGMCWFPLAQTVGPLMVKGGWRQLGGSLFGARRSPGKKRTGLLLCLRLWPLLNPFDALLTHHIRLTGPPLRPSQPPALSLSVSLERWDWKQEYLGALCRPHISRVGIMGLQKKKSRPKLVHFWIAEIKAAIMQYGFIVVLFAI